MILPRFVVTALALFVGLSISCSPKAHGVPPGPAPASFGQDRGGWDAPPGEFSDIQRQGFRDGIEGARKDFDNHRNPDPNNRDEFRHPNVPREMWDAYREGFRRGYEVGVQHLTGGAPMQQGPGPEQMAPLPERGEPGMAEGPGREVMLHGFQDGMVGALRDVEERRQPDPNNRDEFRSPNVPPEMREAYRDGFRHGYEQGMVLLTNGPEREDDFRRHAFEDGVAGALNDFSNNRRPDPDNRDEFRSPKVPYNMQDAYRDSFRHGYERAMSEVTGYSGRR
jgi:hypothetical protein